MIGGYNAECVLVGSTGHLPIEFFISNWHSIQIQMSDKSWVCFICRSTKQRRWEENKIYRFLHYIFVLWLVFLSMSAYSFFIHMAKNVYFLCAKNGFFSSFQNDFFFLNILQIVFIHYFCSKIMCNAFFDIPLKKINKNGRVKIVCYRNSESCYYNQQKILLFARSG